MKKMTILLIIIAYLSCVLYIIFSSSNDQALDLVGNFEKSLDFDSYSVLKNLSSPEIKGFWIVFATSIVIIAILLTSSWLAKNQINKYRPYEYRLLVENRLSVSEILQYHSLYHWGDYAAASIGMMMLSITFIVVNESDLTLEAQVVQSIAVFLMALCTILLVLADIMHTNTQTPIIPIVRRFRLIDLSVQFGTMSVLALLLAILLFVALVSLPLTIILCFIYVIIYCVLIQTRRIDHQEFYEYFNIKEQSQEGWAELNIGIYHNLHPTHSDRKENVPWLLQKSQDK